MNIKIVRTPGGVSNGRDREKIHHERKERERGREMIHHAHKERENDRYSMP
jgi:hypothetical protein